MFQYENMLFRWYCKQKEETFPKDPDNEDELLYEKGHILSDKKLSEAEIQKQKDTSDAELFQEGGCFGKGPGMIYRPRKTFLYM